MKIVTTHFDYEPDFKMWSVIVVFENGTSKTGRGGTRELALQDAMRVRP